MAKSKMTKMPAAAGAPQFGSRAMRPGETDMPNPAPGRQGAAPSLGAAPKMKGPPKMKGFKPPGSKRGF